MIEFILFPEEWKECDELNNSTQIAAATTHGGLPATRYAAN